MTEFYARHELLITVVVLALSTAALLHALAVWYRRRRYGWGSVVVGAGAAVWVAVVAQHMPVQAIAAAVGGIWVGASVAGNLKAREAVSTVRQEGKR